MTEELGKIKNKSLEKAIRVLNCFIEKQPLGITEISEKLGLYKSNVYDILSTLTALEFAVKDEESNKYYLGIGALRLGRAAAQRYSFQEIAAPHIRQIAKEAGEICYLTIPNGYEVYYLDAAIPNDSNSFLASSLRNSTDPMNATGSGKAMLAYMPEEFVEDFLSKPMTALTEYTITDPEQMRTELQKIRMQGYSVDNMENSIGLKCVAVPILTRKGQLVGAMSVSGPSLRFTEEKIRHFIGVLQNHLVLMQQSL